MIGALAASLLIAQAPETAPDPVAVALIACAPPTYEAALTCLDAHLPDTAKKQLAAKDGTVMAHFGLGMFLRNNWGLWGGGSLAQFMREKGVRHPDDMSGYILNGYAARLRGAPRSLDQLLASRRSAAAKPEESHAH